MSAWPDQHLLEPQPRDLTRTATKKKTMLIVSYRKNQKKKRCIFGRSNILKAIRSPVPIYKTPLPSWGEYAKPPMEIIPLPRDNMM